ncbi:MAG: hypothetical protein H6822_33140 [Planctomycetaceae bacterium]|nr:hypothetical protein [Planctomycetaceae bacterium]
MKRIEAQIGDEKADRLSAWAKDAGFTRAEVIVALVTGLLEGQISLGTRAVMIEQKQLAVQLPAQKARQGKSRSRQRT